MEIASFKKYGFKVIRVTIALLLWILTIISTRHGLGGLINVVLILLAQILAPELWHCDRLLQSWFATLRKYRRFKKIRQAMSCVLWLEILGSVFYGIPAWIIVVLVLCNILLVPEPWHLVTLANKWQAWRQ